MASYGVGFDVLFAKNVPHLLEKIFLSLDYESYKTCMEVNQTWNQLLVSESYMKISKSLFSNEISMDTDKLGDFAANGNVRQVKNYYVVK